MANLKSKRQRRKEKLILCIVVCIIHCLLLIGYLNVTVINRKSKSDPTPTDKPQSVSSLITGALNVLFGRVGHPSLAKLCLSPYVMPVNRKLQSLLRQQNMLHYFRNSSKYIVSVPKWQVNVNHERRQQLPYFLTTVLRVRLYTEDKAKWTIRELKQWLHFQFWAGVEHVYICNHYLNESERIDIHLQKYIKLNLVTIYPWNHLKAVPGTMNYHKRIMYNQLTCYRHIVRVHGQDSVWQYSMDMDENPYVIGDTCEGFLPRYLRKLDNSIDQVRLDNYVLQGQGDRSRDLIYERITRISPERFNGLTKPIYKPSYAIREGIHAFQVIGRTIRADGKQLKLLHYWGARNQNWGNDTAELYNQTSEFLDLRHSIAVNVRHSLIAFQEYDAFSSETGP